MPKLNHIDDKAAAKAIVNDPETCPYCGGDLVDVASETIYHYREMQTQADCDNCGASFRIIYGISSAAVETRPTKGLFIGMRVRKHENGYATDAGECVLTHAMLKKGKCRKYIIDDIEKHLGPSSTVTLKGRRDRGTVEDWMLRPA